MKFFAFSALAAVASATQYYGGARLSGLTTNFNTLSSPAYTSSYNTLAAPAYTTGYNTLNTVAVPAVQKVVAVAQPALGVQRVGLSGYGTTGLVGGYSGLTYGQSVVAPLAVQTVQNVQYQDVPSGGSISPISVEVDANPIPINMVFRSASSQLNVEQAHQGAAGSFQESASEDEAQVLRQTVTKPVIQEVREVITPFRKITQEIQPVSESINTIVARGVNKAVLAAPALQTVAAPALQTVAAPVATYEKVIAAPAVQTFAAPAVQTFAAPVQTLATQYIARPATQVLTASPLNFQKTYGAVNAFNTVNTLRGVSTLNKEY